MKATELYSLFKTSLQDDLKLTEPRRVIPPPGYASFDCVATGMLAALTTVAVEVKRGGIEAVQQYNKVLPTFLASVCAIIAEGVPVYYLGEDFLRAVVDTEYPDDVRMGDMKWPRPGMVLCLPRQFCLDYYGVEVPCIYAATMIKGGEYSYPRLFDGHLRLPEVVTNKDGRVSWAYAVYDNNKTEPSMFGSAYRHSDHLSDTKRYEYWNTVGETGEQLDASQAMVAKTDQLVVKLLLVLESRSSYIEAGSIIRTARIKKGRQEPALHHPNTIGWSYRRPVIADAISASGGKMPPHKRRAHIAHVFIGKRGEPFISVAKLPKTAAGQIEWTKVSEADRELFWKCHRRVWIEEYQTGIEQTNNPTQ